MLWSANTLSSFENSVGVSKHEHHFCQVGFIVLRIVMLKFGYLVNLVNSRTVRYCHSLKQRHLLEEIPVFSCHKGADDSSEEIPLAPVNNHN